jgi:MYXO-CTERM domain-containing protein
VLVGGTNSRDPEGAPLSYSWTIAGSVQNVAGDASSLLSFQVPEDAGEGQITVTLVVSDGLASSEPASATITVKPDPKDDDCACSTTRTGSTLPRQGVLALAFGLFAVALGARRRRP